MGREGGQGGMFFRFRLDLKKWIEMMMRRKVGRRKGWTECRMAIFLVCETFDKLQSMN